MIFSTDTKKLILSIIVAVLLYKLFTAPAVPPPETPPTPPTIPEEPIIEGGGEVLAELQQQLQAVGDELMAARDRLVAAIDEAEQKLIQAEIDVLEAKKADLEARLRAMSTARNMYGRRNVYAGGRRRTTVRTYRR